MGGRQLPDEAKKEYYPSEIKDGIIDLGSLRS